MRIIHTSDWHLGRTFGPMPLLDDQARFADWFVDVVADQRADVVVIAGDIYDRAIAPVEAIELFRSTLRRLLEIGTTVVAITGNHDGADRVAPYGDLLDRDGLIIRGGYAGAGDVVRLTVADGPLDVVLLPFLEPQAAPDEYGADTDAAVDADGHTATTADVSGDDAAGGADRAGSSGDVGALVERRRRRTHESVLAAAATRARARLGAPRSLAVAHAFVTGGQTSDSERSLTVGGTGDVGVHLFDGFSYTALGHLHRPQHVTGSVRYSGTPLAYSFSEEHPKSITVVDLDTTGSARVEAIGVEVGRAVTTLTGELHQLLDPTRHPTAARSFVRAIITDRETVLDAKSRLQQLYPYVVEIRLQPAGLEPAERIVVGQGFHERSPLEVTREFWEAAEGAPPDEAIDAVLADAIARAIGAGDDAEVVS